MKVKIITLFILFTFALTGCQKGIILEHQSTNLLIQYSDDVSPCRVFITPEHVGKVQTWKINGNVFKTAFVNDSCTKELILEPHSDIHLQYETIINDIVYTYDDLIKSPPIANKLTIYSLNFYNESFDDQNNSLFMRFNYDFEYVKDTSAGGISGGGGIKLIYNEASSQQDLYSPLEVKLSPVFGDRTTPHILHLNVDNSDTLYCTSFEDLQSLYFNFRFNYDDDSINNPNLITLKNNISGQDYELIVDWSYN